MRKKFKFNGCLGIEYQAVGLRLRENIPEILI